MSVIKPCLTNLASSSAPRSPPEPGLAPMSVGRARPLPESPLGGRSSRGDGWWLLRAAPSTGRWPPDAPRPENGAPSGVVATSGSSDAMRMGPTAAFEAGSAPNCGGECTRGAAAPAANASYSGAPPVARAPHSSSRHPACSSHEDRLASSSEIHFPCRTTCN